MPRRARVRAVLPRLLLLSLALLPSKGERNESSDAAPCPTHLSIAIPDGESHLLGDGSLAHGERVYPAGSHWREAAGNGTQRGCICLLAPSPCLRKCCGPGELVAPTPSLSKLNQCVPAANASESAALGLEAARVSPEMRRRLVERPDLRDWFALFESPSCADEYVFMDLNPGRYPEDEYLLQENGSIWVRAQGLLPIGRFCVDRQAGSKDLAVLACLRRDVVPEEETPTAVKVGYLLSIPFLVVTFFVYAIIPELRNIYGKTLMCYVASLLMAYSSISITHFFTFGTGCHVTDKRSDSEETRSNQCSKYELYNSCSPSCERTCDDINNDDHSGERCSTKNDCVEKCVCKKNYIREHINGKCIRIQECPRVKH